MKSTPLWQTIISYIIPLISIFLSYLFGHMQATKNNKISVNEKDMMVFIHHTHLRYTLE